jgi:hypothetical protein
MAHRHSVAHVQSDTDPICTEAAYEPLYKAWVAQRRGSDNGSCRSNAQDRRDCLFVAQAAGNLAGDLLPHCLNDSGDDLRLAASSVARTVQIHDVDPLRSGRHKSARDFSRVRSINRLAGKVAFG